MITIARIRGRRVVRDVPRSEPTAELKLKFYGTGNVEIRASGNDSSSPITILVDRKEFMRAVLGQITGSEIVNAYEDPGVASKVWLAIYRRFGG